MSIDDTAATFWIAPATLKHYGREECIVHTLEQLEEWLTKHIDPCDNTPYMYHFRFVKTPVRKYDSAGTV